MLPECVPGDNFLFLQWGTWWSFRWQLLSLFFPGKTGIKLPPKIHHILHFGDGKILAIAKNHPKPSQKISEQIGPSIHEIKVFLRILTKKFTRTSPTTWEDKLFIARNTFITLNFWDRSRIQEMWPQKSSQKILLASPTRHEKRKFLSPLEETLVVGSTNC